MGVRTRVLDIKAGAAKLKADRAARLKAELVVDRWNRRLATGRDMLWSPTIRAALLAETPWLDVFCSGCVVPWYSRGNEQHVRSGTGPAEHLDHPDLRCVRVVGPAEANRPLPVSIPPVRPRIGSARSALSWCTR
jgi:hypothetical protein